MTAFNDRFTFDNPVFASIVSNLDNATDDQLAQSKELLTIASMVRRHSILIRSAELKEIYEIITTHSDPEIALILASAKNPDGTFKYASENAVKQFMFGSAESTVPGYINSTNNIFRDGIRRITAAFAASLLVNKLGIVEKQADIAEYIHKIGEQELDRILSLPDRLTSSQSPAAEEQSASLYFEPTEFVAETDLVMEFFMPDGSVLAVWQPAATFLAGTTVSTKQIALVLADVINRYTLNTANNANIIGALSLNGKQSYYSIDFSIRSLSVGLASELLSVRFTYGTSGVDKVPFNWGYFLNNLGKEPLNSSLFLVKNAKESKLLSSSLDPSSQRYVIYFRNKNPLISSNSSNKLVYRLSATEDTLHSVELPAGTLDANRFSQTGLMFLNDLHQYRDESRLLGAIVRNDSRLTDSFTAVELICWSITNPETKLVLDILEVPSNVEIALGDLTGPISQFTSNALSVVCTATYKHFYPLGTLGTGKDSLQPSVIKMARSKLSERIIEESRAVNGAWYV